MKIIDLLLIISKGYAPRKIKFDNKEWYMQDNYMYCCEGVYLEEYLDTIVSALAFLSVAFSTNSSILLTVESLYKEVTLISRISPLLILPESKLCHLKVPSHLLLPL